MSMNEQSILLFIFLIYANLEGIFIMVEFTSRKMGSQRLYGLISGCLERKKADCR